MPQLQERAFHCKKENRRAGVNAKFHTDKCGTGFTINILCPAEFGDTVDHEFLYQIRTVRDAGDERCAGNRNAT